MQTTWGYKDLAWFLLDLFVILHVNGLFLFSKNLSHIPELISIPNPGSVLSLALGAKMDSSSVPHQFIREDFVHLFI